MIGRPVLIIAFVLTALVNLLFCFQVRQRVRIDGLHAEIWSCIVPMHTEYAQDYSHARFNKVRVGMTEREVLELLGDPLDRWLPYSGRTTRKRFPHKADFIAFSYSRSPTSKSYRLRQVILDRGKVAEIRGCFYAD